MGSESCLGLPPGYSFSHSATSPHSMNDPLSSLLECPVGGMLCKKSLYCPAAQPLEMPDRSWHRVRPPLWQGLRRLGKCI
jgi:hypothetical protein